jgi:hypothetical protein
MIFGAFPSILRLRTLGSILFPGPAPFMRLPGVEDLYLIASGFSGEPTAPVIGSAGATNMNS